MRIIDSEKTKDFYDCVQGLGMDRSNVWLRTPIYYKYEFVTNNMLGRSRQDWDTIHLNETLINIDMPRDFRRMRGATIGFCGKVYLALWQYEMEHYTAYSIEDYDKVMELVKDKKVADYEKYHNTNGRTRRWASFSQETRQTIKGWFDWYAQNINRFNGVFTELKTPVFVIYHHRHGGKVIANYNHLGKVYQFQHVMAPYVAFQEINMYMGNVLGWNGDKPSKYKGMDLNTVMSNADMAASKGFEGKYAFRKEPASQRKDNG